MSGPPPPPASFVVGSPWPLNSADVFVELQFQRIALSQGFSARYWTEKDAGNYLLCFDCSHEDKHGPCSFVVKVTTFNAADGCGDTYTSFASLIHNHPLPPEDSKEVLNNKKEAAICVRKLEKTLLELTQNRFDELFRGDVFRAGYETHEKGIIASRASQQERMVWDLKVAVGEESARKFEQAMRENDRLARFYPLHSTLDSYPPYYIPATPSSATTVTRATTYKESRHVRGQSVSDASSYELEQLFTLPIGGSKTGKVRKSGKHNTDLYATADSSSTARCQTLQAAPYELSSSDDDDDHESEHSTDEVLVLCCKDKVAESAPLASKSKSKKPLKKRARLASYAESSATPQPAASTAVAAGPTASGLRFESSPCIDPSSLFADPSFFAKPSTSLGTGDTPSNPLALQLFYDQFNARAASSSPTNNTNSPPLRISSIGSSPPRASSDTAPSVPSVSTPSISPTVASNPALTPLRHYLSSKLASGGFEVWKDDFAGLANALGTAGIRTVPHFESEIASHLEELVEDLKGAGSPGAVVRQFKRACEKKLEEGREAPAGQGGVGGE